jgi:exonuclease SbcC
MKILAIRLKNLASLEYFTEINFMQPPLSTAGIFAITGPTGAGKSTILDALCLALYGKTPRYLQAKEQGIEVRDGKTGFINQGDCRGILRDGTGDGYAEVDFIAVDGTAHTATWRVRRARDKADGVMQGDTLELKNLHTGVPFPGKKRDIADETERLIGLNFEQFTRSVLLAQGDFTAFLKAAKDDKSSLLEKLTGTHIYSEISRSIFENHKTQEQQLRDLNIKREGIATLTVEEIAGLEEKHISAKEIISGRQIELTAFEREITWHQQLKMLGDNVKLAVDDAKATVDEKQFATDRIAFLNRVESVQLARKLIDQQNHITGQLSGKNESLATVEKTVLHLKEQHQEAVTILKAASETYTESNEKFNQAKPLLIEARKLDVTISERQQQLKDAEKTVALAADLVLRKKQLIEASKTKTDELLASIEALGKWKSDNQERQPIAEQEGIIISKLGDAEKILKQSNECLEQLARLEKDIKTEDRNLQTLNAKASPLKATFDTLKENIELLATTLSVVDITQLESEKCSLDLNVSDLSGALAHWEKLLDKMTDFKSSTDKLNVSKTTHGKKLPQLASFEEELNTLKVKKDTSLEMVHKAQMAIGGDVEKLRAQLNEGDPCPVCGSESHPYTSEDHRLKAVMEELQVAHKESERAYLEKHALCSTLQENISQLTKEIASGSSEIVEKEKALLLLNELWKAFAVYNAILNVPDEEKTNWLAAKLKHTDALRKSRQEKIASYNLQKKQEEQLGKQLRIAEKEVQENITETNSCTQNRQLLHQQHRSVVRENEKLMASLQQIKSSLGLYFTNTEWFVKWQNDRALFEERIKNFATDWKGKNKHLTDNTMDLHITQATLSEQQAQLQNLLGDKQIKQTLLSGLRVQNDRLLQQRQSIFNGDAADKVENSFKENLAKALESLELQKSAEQHVQNALAKALAQAEQLQKDVDLLNLQQLTATQNTDQWINTYKESHSTGFEIGELLELLQHSQEWIEEERKVLRKIDDAITKALSVLQERTGRLQQHEQQRLSGRKMEELEILKEQSTVVLQEAAVQKTETELLLHQDEENRKKIGFLLKAIDAQAIITDNWAKLNDIIGSSDGKKFRQMAQEYTLDVLLGYANIHLQSLSQRYLLERIPNTLGLQVLDQDMGNEVRTVFSLSGGESFLVSLALALGLASLSSSRMQVESLFIDEGFGSLDPATLNIAMEALERLHNQGRKVGVISHVQEMTERIAVQIKVSKQNSGRSKVEVIDNFYN